MTASMVRLRCPLLGQFFIEVVQPFLMPDFLIFPQFRLLDSVFLAERFDFLALILDQLCEFDCKVVIRNRAAPLLGFQVFASLGMLGIELGKSPILFSLEVVPLPLFDTETLVVAQPVSEIAALGFLEQVIP